MKESIIKLIKRFFFPKFSNRITWFVLLLGSSLFGSSIIENIVTSLIEKEFKISIINSYDNLFGLICIFLALSYNATILYFESKQDEEKKKISDPKKEKIISHDIEKYNLFESIINENLLDSLLNDIGGAHYIKHNDISVLTKFTSESSKSSNEFVINSLNNEFKLLNDSIIKLERFISINFFSNHNINNQISYLFPEGNVERAKYGFDPKDELEYKKLADQLNDLVFEIEDRYKVYRKTIKTELLK
jgi:hypothetical protein